MLIEIKSWIDGSVLWLCQAETLKEAVEMAVKAGASLNRASLIGASLNRAILTPIRDDLWAVLSSAPCEAAALRDKIIAGQIDGSHYEGACACLVGTIANVRHCRHTEIPTLKPNPDRPSERWFLAIKPGDTPCKSQFAKLAVEWIYQWLANIRTFSETKV